MLKRKEIMFISFPFLILIPSPNYYTLGKHRRRYESYIAIVTNTLRVVFAIKRHHTHYCHIDTVAHVCCYSRRRDSLLLTFSKGY